MKRLYHSTFVVSQSWVVSNVISVATVWLAKRNALQANFSVIPSLGLWDKTEWAGSCPCPETDQGNVYVQAHLLCNVQLILCFITLLTCSTPYSTQLLYHQEEAALMQQKQVHVHWYSRIMWALITRVVLLSRSMKRCLVNRGWGMRQR